eukprot:scaffold662_cov248-Pinguiococcus_pyrenoidosus.AAC.3
MPVSILCKATGWSGQRRSWDDAGGGFGATTAKPLFSCDCLGGSLQTSAHKRLAVSQRRARSSLYSSKEYPRRPTCRNRRASMFRPLRTAAERPVCPPKSIASCARSCIVRRRASGPDAKDTTCSHQAPCNNEAELAYKKCDEEAQRFVSCSKANGFLVVFNCREQLATLRGSGAQQMLQAVLHGGGIREVQSNATHRVGEDVVAIAAPSEGRRKQHRRKPEVREMPASQSWCGTCARGRRPCCVIWARSSVWHPWPARVARRCLRKHRDQQEQLPSSFLQDDLSVRVARDEGSPARVQVRRDPCQFVRGPESDQNRLGSVGIHSLRTRQRRVLLKHLPRGHPCRRLGRAA